MSYKTILSGSLYQESHSFNPIPTGRDQFQIAFGQEALDAYRGTRSVLGGVIDTAEAAGFSVIVPASFRAFPSGIVDDAVYAEFKAAMLDAARHGGFDAIVLALHGAMVTTAHDDPEGDLIRSLRDIVGPTVPITAGLDLHAHVTPYTLAACDFLTGYKTNPHADMAETGERAMRGALAMLAGRFEPVCVSVHFPMLTLGQDRTDEEPLMGLHARVRALVETSGLFDISIFNVQQFLDVAHMGQTVIAYGNGQAEPAWDAAHEIADALWAARDELVGVLPDIHTCLTRAAEPGRTRPVVIGDQGDRVAAGGPGDSTFVLNTLLADFPALRAALPIRDAASVRRCRDAEIGDMVELSIGGRYSTETPPVSAACRLLARGSNVDVVIKGPAMGGVSVATGPYAVVQLGQVRIALTELPLTYLDPRFYEALGIPVAEQQVVVARSGYHFTLNYADSGDCMTCDTVGMTAYRPAEQPFTVARPFYPVDKIAYQPVTAVRRRRLPGG
ncbi:microcystin degradation protein MlrC [Xylophilus rhododendri]|uniref:Microcystinase C n=1 Tax=Xylophilus rhododendri TaxID=2697032 RepID=A0A857J1H1_9BURK|nr:M81 family metallopeptidase [Xylophilus rhododendri]QHI97730.1 microcystin degradation protein MlrC [Xylophilus rhododendri]